MPLQAALLVAALGLMSPIGSTAHAQVHQQTFDGYVVRANVVAATSLPEAQAREHGIKVSPDRLPIHRGR